MRSIIKYTILSLLLCLSIYKILGDRITPQEIIMIGILAAIFAGIIDLLLPDYFIEYDE